MRRTPLAFALVLAATVAHAGPKILILSSDSSTAPAAVKTALQNSGAFGQVDLTDVQQAANVPTLATLKTYDAVLTWSWQTYGDRTTLGNNLADYVDAGGGVVQAMFAMYTSWDLQGRWSTGKYSCINTGSFNQGAASMLKAQPADPNSPLVGGITQVSSPYYGTGGLAQGAVSVWDWQAGQPFLATCTPNGHRRVDVNVNPNSAGNTTGDYNVALKNALLYVAGGFNPVRGTPSSVSFPNTGVGAASSPVTVTYTNQGMAAQTVTGMVIAGTNPADFGFSKLPAFPQTLAVGASLTVDVIFQPTAVGARSASLKASVSGQMFSSDVSLAGTGTPAALRVMPYPIAMGGSPAVGQAITKDVSIANQGMGQVQVMSAAISAGQANFSIQNPPQFPVSLAGGGSFPLTIKFLPTMNGAASGTLTVTSNDPNAPTINVPIGACAGPPGLALDAGSVAFGNVNVGATSPAQIINVTNTGCADLVVNSITSSGNNAGDFVIDPKAFPGNVQAGLSGPFAVSFKPTATGNRSATITVNTNAGTKTVTVFGTGTTAMVTVTPASLDFGSVKVGSKSPAQNFTVANNGTGTLKVLAIDFGGNAAFFLPQGGLMPPFSVGPMGQTVAAVQCQPSMLGKTTATMTITTDVGPATVALACAGTAPKLSVSPANVDFGGVPVATQSPAITVTLTNSGTDTLTLQTLNILGANQADFASMDIANVTKILAPGASTKLSIVFTPQNHAAESAELDIASDDPQAMLLKVPLTGSGIQAGITVAPMTVDCGSVLVGSSAAMRPVTITNTGDQPITITDISTGGAGGGQFSVDKGGPQTIPVAGSATVNVTFHPTMAGTIQGTLTLSPMKLVPVTIALKGIGLSPMIQLSPTSYDFGPVPTGASSEPLMVGVKNGSPGMLTIGTIASSDPSYVIDSSATTMALGAGQVTTFKVTFAPSATGARNANIALTLKGGSSAAVTAMVTGTGVMAKSGGCSVAAGAPSRPGATLALLALALAALALRRRR